MAAYSDYKLVQRDTGVSTGLLYALMEKSRNSLISGYKPSPASTQQYCGWHLYCSTLLPKDLVKWSFALPCIVHAFCGTSYRSAKIA